MKQKPRSDSGFTLLELLISMAMIAILMTTCLMIVRLATSSRDAGTQKADVHQRLRVLSERLNSTLRSAHLIFVTPESQPLFPDEKKEEPLDDAKVLAFEGKEDSLRFVTFSEKLMKSKNLPSMHQVHFYLHKNEETGLQEILLNERDFSPESFFKPDAPGQKPGKTLLLAQDVAHLKFEYHYKISEEENSLPTEGEKPVKVSSEETDKNTTEPFDFKSSIGDNNKIGDKQDAIRIPRAVEISVALWKSGRPEKGAEPEMVELPSILIPIQSGKVFARIKEDDEENDESSKVPKE